MTLKFSSVGRRLSGVLACAAGFFFLTGQAGARQMTGDGAWTLVPVHTPAVQAEAEWVRPRAGQALVADLTKLRGLLFSAPLEGSDRAKMAPLILELPDPDGVLQKFRVLEAPIMEAKLAAKFPEIRTLIGQGITDPMASLRADITMLGFHAQVLTPSNGPGGSWYIDPYSRNDFTSYTSYYRRSLNAPADKWTCGVAGGHDGVPQLQLRGGPFPPPSTGGTLRTYRLACACTGEYAAFFGGTAALAQSAIVAAINRATGVYEVENCIRLTLVANNTSIVYTNASTDPYANTNGSTMLGQNQTNLTSVIGSANYDIGHVFSTGGGGVAGLGVVCSAGNKARGVTGSPSPTGDAFWIDYVVHEMGHEFGANHNFQGTTSNCGGGNRNGSTADEPGSGSTIMGYAGICGADDLQPHSDAYFNFISYQEIQAYVAGAGCGATAPTTNTPPTISATGGFTIPKGTPFALTASASDPNGDAVTYCWEDRNFGNATSSVLSAADNGSMPLFRSLNPTTSPTRYFPKLATVVAGTTDNQEKLPQLARAAFNFRVTARDNRSGGGGVNTADVTMAVSGVAGPFTIVSPSGATSWAGGTSQTVTWNVAGTTASGVNTASVAILLSSNGGVTFPTTLVASTPNSGSATITVPNTSTTTGRIMVQAVGNVFYAVNNAAITITPGGCVGAGIGAQPSAQTACAGGSATLSVAATGSTPISYQWQRAGADIAGATSPTLTFSLVSTANAGSYGVVVSNSCGTLTSNSVPLTVNTPVSISSSPTSITRCPGSSAAFTVTAAGVPTPTYQWRKGGVNIAGATTPTLTIGSVAAPSAGSYDCVVTNPCGGQASGAGTLTVSSGATIATQPASQTVCEGDAVNFSVVAGGGGPYTYQWKRNGADISATGTSYTLSPVDPSDAGSYSCTVSNACGSVPSNAAVLTVNAAPAITGQPASLTRCTGAAASFGVMAGGFAPIAYQWRKNGSNIGGATGSTLTIASVAPGDAAAYDCVITNPCGTAMSASASLTVSDSPSITGQPTPQTVCAGAPASFTISAGGSPPLAYQWRKSTLALPGATGATFTLPVTVAGDAGSYDCIVTNGCSTTAASASVVLTVRTAPAITAQPADLARCPGSPASFTVAATGLPAPTYQWRKNSADLPGATAPTYTLAAVSAADAGGYDCIVTNACASATSTAAQLTLSSGPSITSQPVGGSACPGDSVTFSVMAAGDSPLGYQWRRDGVDLPGQTAPTLTLVGVGAPDAGSYDCVVSNACGSLPSSAAVLSIGGSGVMISQQPAPQDRCAGASASFSVTATGAASYQWRKDGAPLADGPSGSGSGSAIAGATGDTLSITLISAADAGTYDCTLASACGPATSTGAALSLADPVTITQQPAGQSGCAGAPAALSVAATGGTPLSYQWRKNGTPLPGAASATLNFPALHGADNGSYDCVVTNPCGDVPSSTATVAVCTADFNCSGVVSVQDIFDFLAAFFGNDPRADVNDSGVVGVQDIFDYLAAYFTGCA